MRPRSRASRRRGGLERRQFITHNLIAAAGTWGAGVFGLLMQALISHHFQPRVFGQVFAVFSFYIIITGPAAAFGRMIAWSTSSERATRSGATLDSNALLRTTNNRLLATGAAIAIVCIAVAPALAAYLHVGASVVVLGALSVPFMLATAPLLAALQGEQRWVSWSMLSLGIALARLVFVVALVFPFGIAGVMLGMSIGAFVIYVLALVMVWPRLRRASGSGGWRRQWRFLVLSLGSTVMMSVLSGSDVLMVQHFFTGRPAGQFSAVAVTSRALYFAMNSVGSVLFPMVAARHARSRSSRRVVTASVVIAIGGGLLGLLAFSAGGHLILRHFSGRAYEAGAGYSGVYALGMPLLAAVLILSNTQQTLADLSLLWIMVPAAAVKPLLIFFFHGSLVVVSVMSDVSIVAVLLALTVRYALWVRRHERARVRAQPVTESLAAAELRGAQAPQSVP
jgi:O-antigen/teichoic acid export membrane protein